MRWVSGLFADRRVVGEREKTRREIRLGIVGVVLVALLAVAAGVLYAAPIGKKTYTADLAEAQSVKAGDDIRVAGISVGTVKSLELKPDRVVMRFTVDSEVFVGDKSTLDIRMLTVVGGNYVALFPSGSVPLGDKHIPMDRVRLPYSLVQTFQDAAEPIREIDGDTLRRNLAALGTSVAQAPDTLRTTLDSLSSFVDDLNRQHVMISKAIANADEYTTMYDGAKSSLGRLVESTNLMEDLVLGKQAELREGLRLLNEVIGKAAAIAPTYAEVKPKLQQLFDAVPRMEELLNRLDPVVGSVRDLQQKLSAMAIPDGGVTIDQSGQTITAPADALARVCVPLPGRDC
ncbi:phospholipid/cholesterol/gamma-HCH transport system substrate-binding protein [Nocardia tenerifensis]|uniref:Phospholipid/cholesterol/gamma-HCH transport system substrate-binding protein n=1 Tax=Nocardia tenerifensis TaxID=228006 RepID=A0A318JVN9_9NOCA|nr:MlaD family protein [Nocardia tenerifensis]PXX61513.1 phospholipid/cholesterol/gamma-HCH transport system substrate-binding protein [Nocardia tenerifensis]